MFYLLQIGTVEVCIAHKQLNSLLIVYLGFEINWVMECPKYEKSLFFNNKFYMTVTFLNKINTQTVILFKIIKFVITCVSSLQ